MQGRFYSVRFKIIIHLISLYTLYMKATIYSQPKLPYAPDALAPAISQETVEYHYGKHEKAYIDNLNALIKDTKYEDMDLEDIITSSEGPLFNNASQAWNHISPRTHRAHRRSAQGH